MIKKLLANLGDSFYFSTLERELHGMQTVLDVGCGSWSPLARVKKSFKSVGIDMHKPSIEELKKLKIHDECKVGNVLKLNRYFKPKSFDAVIALDVIEHLEKDEGYKLLSQMESIAKKKVIIVTPFGFTEQHPSDGNPYQIHKSGWYINDFKNRGYKVFGLRGFRFIRGEFANIKYKPWLLWGIIASISQFFVYLFPTLAYQLLAVKNFKKKTL